RDRLHGRVEQRHLVSQGLSEAPGLQKVALHVDDDERGTADIDRQGLGLRVDQDGRTGVRRGRGHRRSPSGARTGAPYRDTLSGRRFGLAREEAQLKSLQKEFEETFDDAVDRKAKKLAAQIEQVKAKMQAVKQTVAAMPFTDKKNVYLGSKLIFRYGCYACHDI